MLTLTISKFYKCIIIPLVRMPNSCKIVIYYHIWVMTGYMPKLLTVKALMYF